MEERNPKVEGRHTLTMKDCGEMMLTGIHDVISFDEKEIQLDSDCGRLQVRGEELHVKSLVLERGEARLTGKICQIQYVEDNGFVKNGQTLFGRLFH